MKPPLKRALAALIGAAMLAAGLYWFLPGVKPRQRFERALLALEQGDRQSAAVDSQRLMRTRGFEPHGHLLAGMLLAKSERIPEAIAELQLAAEADEIAVRALTAAAECFYQIRRLSEVINVATLALEKDAGAIDARRYRAGAYYDLGATTEASADLTIIAQQAPADFLPHRLLGLIDKDHEHFATAVDHYHEALKRNPPPDKRQEILLERAESEVKLSRFEDALESLVDCDESAETLALIAECHNGLGQSDDAARVLTRALELNPEFLPALLQQGVLLMAKGQTTEAALILERAVTRHPYSSRAHFHLSQAYGRVGESDKAAEQLVRMKEAQAIEREFVDLHEQLGQQPTNAELRFRLGTLAEQLGKQAELARMWYEAALAIDSNHAGARAALERLEDEADSR